MKRKTRLIWAIVALIAILGVGTTSVAAQATRTSFEGEAWFMALLDPGTYTYPGVNRHLRGAAAVEHIQTDDPRVTGDYIVTVNANVNDDTSVGPLWGTFRLEDGEGQVLWEGTWQGYQLEDGSSVTYGVGHGSGDFKSMQVKIVTEWPPGPPFTGIARITGYILDPHGD
jgi:hypothetical protein